MSHHIDTLNFDSIECITYVCVCVYVCVLIGIRVCMYVSTYVDTYRYIHTYLLHGAQSFLRS